MKLSIVLYSVHYTTRRPRLQGRGRYPVTQFRVIVVTNSQTQTHTHTDKHTDRTDYNTLRRSHS